MYQGFMQSFVLESTCPLTSPCEIAILVAIHNRHIVNNYRVSRGRWTWMNLKPYEFILLNPYLNTDSEHNSSFSTFTDLISSFEVPIWLRYWHFNQNYVTKLSFSRNTN